jgi:crotonobetainyl-CoA:carnitine CoA-transferase CaiB-like acyl-CoA transferase
MVGIYYRTYATRDATLAVACVSPGMQRAFAAAIGIEDSAQGRPLPDREAAERHYAPLRRQAEAILASRTTAEWKAILDARGIPAAGVKFAVEILDDSQALANGFVHDLAHPTVGPIRVLAPPLRLDGDGFTPSSATAAFGSESRAILAELGFAQDEITGLLGLGVSRET